MFGDGTKVRLFSYNTPDTLIELADDICYNL